jgi:hypothetical protein
MAQVNLSLHVLFSHSFQVLLAGITGALAGAISMGLSEYIGVFNSALHHVCTNLNCSLQQQRANEK